MDFKGIAKDAAAGAVVGAGVGMVFDGVSWKKGAMVGAVVAVGGPLVRSMLLDALIK